MLSSRWSQTGRSLVLACGLSALLVLSAACLPGAKQGPTRIALPTPGQMAPAAATPTAVASTTAADKPTPTPTAAPATRLPLAATSTALPSPTPGTSEVVDVPWPTTGWLESTPEEQGIDSLLLRDMYAGLREQAPGVGSVVIVRHGYLVAEGYVAPFGQEDTQHLFSVTKSVVSALVGIATEEGRLPALDRRVLDVFSDHRVNRPDEWKQEMTLYHLLTMTCGLDWRELTAENDRLAEMIASPDWVQAVLDMPMVARPGDVFNYNSGASHLLSAAIQQGTGQETAAYARQKVFAPLGITSATWRSDPQGISIGGWGLSLTARDMARFGYLYLRGGAWDGAQIVPAEWVRASTTSQVAVPGSEPGLGYGYQWWIVGDLPYAAFEARGRFGQRITVIPELDMVVVFTSPVESHGAPGRLLREYILPAVRSSESMPVNPDGYAALQLALEQLARP